MDTIVNRDGVRGRGRGFSFFQVANFFFSREFAFPKFGFAIFGSRMSAGTIDLTPPTPNNHPKTTLPNNSPKTAKKMANNQQSSGAKRARSVEQSSAEALTLAPGKKIQGGHSPDPSSPPCSPEQNPLLGADPEELNQAPASPYLWDTITCADCGCEISNSPSSPSRHEPGCRYDYTSDLEVDIAPASPYVSPASPSNACGCRCLVSPASPSHHEPECSWAPTSDIEVDIAPASPGMSPSSPSNSQWIYHDVVPDNEACHGPWCVCFGDPDVEITGERSADSSTDHDDNLEVEYLGGRASCGCEISADPEDPFLHHWKCPLLFFTGAN